LLVGVLISIMISIVVGVSLVPTIVESINTSVATIDASTHTITGLTGLLDVLAYVFVAVNYRIAACRSNFTVSMSQIRGKLNTLVHANPELNLSNLLGKCVETRRFTPRVWVMV